MTPVRERSGMWLAAASALSLASCASARASAVGPYALPPLADPLLVADTARVDTVAPGVLHRYYHVGRGPWAVNVLDVDRAECWTAVAAKGGAEARGRRRTSEIAKWASGGHTEWSSPEIVAGAVNADFFALADGTPQGLHMHARSALAGPSRDRPVFGMTGQGPWIGTAGVRGIVVVGADSFPLTSVNRPDRSGIALFAENWGARTPPAPGAIEVLVGRHRWWPGTPPPDAWGPVYGVDTLPAGVAIPVQGIVLQVGALADAASRTRFLALRPGHDTVTLDFGIEPSHLGDAVGGRPVLLADGREAAGLDSAGGAAFAAQRHPRTAVGHDSSGRRLILVTVDGRQPPYSAGMTLRELAVLMRDLGAYEALNLDGGGSTTMVVRARGDSGRFQVVNKPSDAEGERPVGNALAIARTAWQLGLRRSRDFRDERHRRGLDCYFP